MKKIISMISCVCLITGILVGCGQQEENVSTSSAGSETSLQTTESSASNEPIKLTLWHNSDRVDFANMITEYYGELYPNVTLEHGYYTSAEIKKNIPISAASNSLPSIFVKSNGATCKSLTENGYIADLTEIAERDGWKDKYYSWIYDEILAEGNGKVTQYPWFYQMFACMYRTDIADKLGLKVPTTMAEFENNLAVYRDNGYAPLTLGGSSGTHILRLWTPILEMYAGSELLDSLFAMEADWRCEAVESTFSKLKEWSDNGYCAEGFMTLGPNDARLLLYTGQAGLTFDNGGLLQNMRKEFGGVENYDFYQLPRDGGGSRLNFTLESYLFNANLSAEELDYAVKWMDLWCSQDVEEIKDQEILWTPVKNAPIQSWAQVCADSMETIIEENGTVPNYDISLPESVYNVLQDVNERVILGTMSPADAAATVQQAIDDYKAAS